MKMDAVKMKLSSKQASKAPYMNIQVDTTEIRAKGCIVLGCALEGEEDSCYAGGPMGLCSSDHIVGLTDTFLKVLREALSIMPHETKTAIATRLLVESSRFGGGDEEDDFGSCEEEY